MSPAERKGLIVRYEEGALAVRAAVSGLSEAALDQRDGEGWSPREVVHHLADAEMIASTRVRRLVAEEAVHLVSYDEALWARTAHYERPIRSALALIAAVRDNTAEFLRSLTEDEWRREGTHSTAGRYTPEVWLEYYANHAHDHAAQIAASRSAI
jgi:hypothetical protein